MSNKDLDSIAEKIRDLKDTFNVEWGNKSHPEAIDDEIGTRGFDQIMDQVFKLIECYQVIDPSNEPATIQKANDAYIEAVKAACGFFETIASNHVTQAREMIRQIKPTPSELMEINTKVNSCGRKIDEARRMWERDRPEGLGLLRDVIVKMDDLLDQINLLVPGVVHAERREERKEVLTRSMVVAMWISGVAMVIGVLVALVLGIINIIRGLPSFGPVP